MNKDNKGRENFNGELSFRSNLKIRHFDKNRKQKAEVKTGDDFWQKGQKWMKKLRIIDWLNNRYFEEIKDPETGQVIHKTDEPLSSHQGHGSAKTKD